MRLATRTESLCASKKCLLPHRTGWGKGGNRERQANCCAEEVDAHHESSSDDATSVSDTFAAALRVIPLFGG